MRAPSYDFVVIGSGPAGQNAAAQAAKAGKTVLVIEQQHEVGGACVQHGTIPSKTMRETAVSLTRFHRRTGEVVKVSLPEHLQLESLMVRKEEVISAHHKHIAAQLDRHGVDRVQGRARFLGPREIEVLSVDGTRRKVTAGFVVIATGSRPREPKDIPIDHEHVLDSDSILTMTYLPRSLTVLGGGVIASEYASIFSALGVKVTMIDRAARPLSFLDPEIVDRFVASFVRSGGRFVAGAKIESVHWDGIDAVETRLEGGEVVRSDKLLFALGRVANVEGLDLEAAGIVLKQGYVEVDEYGCTEQPHVFAVGDVIGPPSLASAAMDQGRRAVRRALGLDPAPGASFIPVGVYTIPEISSVGLTEADAIKRFGSAVVGRASFEELARGQICAAEDGFMKLVADPQGKRLLGVQIVGENAAELVHIGQMALLSGAEVDVFVDTIFNFPTLAEAYRVAALDVTEQRARLRNAA